MSNAVRVIGGLLVSVNSAVPVVAILTSRSLRERCMFQTIANHAAAKTVMGLLMSLSGLPVFLGTRVPPTLCGSFFAIVPALVLASMMALACLCLERYVAVIHGLRYFQLITTQRRRAMLLLPWLSAVMAAVFCSVVLMHAPSSDNCSLEEVPPLIFLVLDSVDLLLCLFILAINTVVALEAARHRRDIRHQRRQVQAAAAEDMDKYRSYKVILGVVGLYTIFLVPNDVVSVVLFYNDSQILRNVKNVAMAMRRTLFILDGWMFGFFCADLRRRYGQMFCGWCCRKDAPVADFLPSTVRKRSRLSGVAKCEARQVKRNAMEASAQATVPAVSASVPVRPVRAFTNTMSIEL